MRQFRDEISRAEFHLNVRRREPHPGLVALAVGLLLVLISGKSANASTAPLMTAQETGVAQDGCSTHLKTLQFAGTFSLKNSRAPKPLRFVIGFPGDAPEGHAIAQIWSGQRCQASCSSIAFEKGDLSVPIALDLQCRGEELGPLSAHVAVLWDHEAGSPTLLRFGTWLEGYEQAAMKVEVDRFNSNQVASRDGIQPSKRKTLAYRAPGLSIAAQSSSEDR